MKNVVARLIEAGDEVSIYFNSGESIIGGKIIDADELGIVLQIGDKGSCIPYTALRSIRYVGKRREKQDVKEEALAVS